MAETVDHVGRVEVFPKQDGRNMIMVLVPGQGTRRQREAAADQRDAAAVVPPVADPVDAAAVAPPVADPVDAAPTPTETPTETSEDTQTETRE